MGRGLVGLSKEDAEHVILVRRAGELQVGDVVKMHSLETEAFNGLFGTLMQWLGCAERWAVQLQKTPGRVINIRADNLMFVREQGETESETSAGERGGQSDPRHNDRALQLARLAGDLGHGGDSAPCCTHSRLAY